MSGEGLEKMYHPRKKRQKAGIGNPGGRHGRIPHEFLTTAPDTGTESTGLRARCSIRARPKNQALGWRTKQAESGMIFMNTGELYVVCGRGCILLG